MNEMMSFFNRIKFFNKMGNKRDKVTVKESLNQDNVQYLMCNTVFSAEQIDEWYKSFMKDCPSGELDKKGFERIFRQFYPNGRVEKFCALAFSAFDADGNGSIDFNEFLIAISTLCNDDIGKKLKFVFKIYDTDHNGQINKKEMKKVLVSMNELFNADNNDFTHCSKSNSQSNEGIKKIVNLIFQRFDKKNCKWISEDEFVNGCLTDSDLLRLLIPNS